jgi:hypothetical protein
MIFAPVYSGLGAVGYIGNQREFPMTWSLQDTPYLKSSTDNEWIIDLPAQQEIVIEASFHGRLHCNSEALGRPNILTARVQQFPHFVGIHFGFDLKLEIKTQLVGEEWQVSRLQQGALLPMVNGQRTFWDLFYKPGPSQFGYVLQHPAQTIEEFINTVRTDVVYDRCVAQ